jgi:catechol 2,3-dioxygenase-like lactoylglutathione lyase family enzyme
MKAKFIYTGIRVKDLEKSIEFYTKVLGMKVTVRAKIDAAKGEVVNLESEAGGHPLELNFYDKKSRFATRFVAGEGLDHLAFQVDDLDAALAEARGLGYPAVLEMKTAKARWAYIVDPNGIYIELVG